MSNFVLDGAHTEPKAVENLLQHTAMRPRTHELAEAGLQAFALESRAGDPGEVAPDAYEAISSNIHLRNAYRDYIETLPPEVQTMLEQSAGLYDALPEQVRQAHVKLDETTTAYSRSDRIDQAKAMIQSVAFVSREDRPKVVAELLFSEDWRTRLDEDVLSVVTTLPRDDRMALFQRVVEYDSANVVTTIKVIKMLAEDDRDMASDYALDLQTRLFANSKSGFYARCAFVELIDLVAVDEQEALRKKAATYLQDALDSNDVKRISDAIEMSDEVTDDDRRRLEPMISQFIKKVLDDTRNSDVIDSVKYAAPSDRAQLLKKAMEGGDPNKYRVFLAVENIRSAPVEARAGLIRYAVAQFGSKETGAPRVYSAIRQIYTVAQEDRAALVTEILDDPSLDARVRLEVAESCDSLLAQNKPEIFAKVRSMIRGVLSSPDLTSWDIQDLANLAACVELGDDTALQSAFDRACDGVLTDDLKYSEVNDTLKVVMLLPEQSRPDYYTKIVASLRTQFLNNAAATKDIVDCIKYIPGQSFVDALRSLKYSGVQAPPNKSPLHINAANGEVISFKYDGETYIGEDENAVRVVPFSAFDAWLRAYTAVDAWKKFGYVPIEPICQVSYADECTTNVAVKTIALRGESLRNTLFYYSTDVGAEILERVNEIRDTVREVVGIDHGHAHEGNFVLVPEKTNGVADPNKMPKVYMIDFDLAASHEVKKLGINLGGGGPGI